MGTIGRMAGTGAAGPRVPLPPLLTVGGAVPLVARGDAWDALEQSWSAAGVGARRVVLVSGDAGAGKTRLVTEFARAMHERGAAVLFGTCSENQSVPYQPFAEALDHLLDHLVAGADSPADAARRLGPDVSMLARLVPRRSALAGLADRPAPADPDADRARLFEAVATAIASVSTELPLLVVLDDLHWARRPTVDLLTHLVRNQTFTNVMFLAAYRSTPSDVGEAMRSALPELRRLPGVARVTLDGLDRSGIEEFVAAAAGHRVDAGLRDVVDVLARETDGNAFLLVERWLQLVETGRVQAEAGRWRVTRPLTDFASPEGVREVVAARLAGLDHPVRELLELASVIGPAFDPGVLATAAAVPIASALSTLDVAVRARIVDDDGAGTYHFAHELIRRSVYEDLASADRRRHHLAVANALDGAAGAAGERSRHLSAAMPLVDRDTVVAAAVQASDAAVETFSYDDAARFLEAALAVAAERSVDLLLRAAHATMRAGDSVGAKQRCLEANELAMRSGDAADRIAVAFAYGEAAWRDARDGRTAAELLRGALAVADDEAVRVSLQAALTRALAVTGDGEMAMMLGEDALSSARRLGEQTALRTALDALSYAPWTPQTIERQLTLMRESVAAARAADDQEWESLSISKLLYGEITIGDLDGARRTIERHRQLATELRQPIFVAMDRQADALIALGEGRLDEAERLAAEADDLTRHLSNGPNGGYGVQMFSIRREQGRLDEARPVVEAVARLDDSSAAWRPALAVMYAELGLLDAAASELHDLTASRLAAIPRDALWAGSLSYLADTCRLVGDATAAAAVYDELVAWRGLVVHVGYLLAAHGAVDRYLGDLAALLGRDREAEIHFEAALRIDQTARMPVWSARTQLAYGRFLAARGRDADRARAGELLAAATAIADRIGLPTITEEAGHWAVPPAPPAAPGATGSAGLTDREWAVIGLVAQGCSNRQIGARLHISQHTAANHVRSILMKTASANRTEAAAWALRRGAPRGH